jgi:hypothetical protein
VLLVCTVYCTFTAKEENNRIKSVILGEIDIFFCVWCFKTVRIKVGSIYLRSYFNPLIQVIFQNIVCLLVAIKQGVEDNFQTEM